MRRAVLCSLIAACLSGCGYSSTSFGPSKDFELRQFGERCDRHVECASTYCLHFGQGDFCTRSCDEGCPDGWSCLPVDNPHAEGTVSLCVMNEQQLCMPCSHDSACGANGNGWCMEIGGGYYCSMDCTFQGCPDGYTCTDVVNAAGRQGRQCLPVTGSCLCDERNVGQSRSCSTTNEFGTCRGVETCGTDNVWGECSARVAGVEECNGIDDDCNGFVDEELDGGPCTIDNEFGSCEGTQLCGGAQGMFCLGATPQAEACNGSDDDCDGEVDEDFRDAQGRYSQPEHCGACGQNCMMRIAHATETACDIVEDKPACRARGCEDGYFPYMGGLSCMALPSNLCMKCSQDSDCVGPDSLCIDTGQEAYCGRDCSATSPYGTDCPEGYTCTDVRDGKRQCTPTSGTCVCNAENVGSARSCSVDTCVGFAWCRNDGGNYTWSACAIDDYNPEICDYEDNNCNGVIDEGARDPVTGLYTTREHCGRCFNNCADYFKPEIHHTEGVCVVSDKIASCGMGPCAHETRDGVEYEWVDTDGVSENGCECLRRLGNATHDDPDVPSAYASGYDFVDENCDGIDGVVGDAIFVSKSASGKGDGTMARPYRTIGDAIAAWPTAGKKYILVAEGLYEEDIVLPDGIVMHGGYSPLFTARDLVSHASTIRGVAADATVRASGLSKRAVVSGFVIEGADRQASDGGRASVAVWLDNTAKVSLYANQIAGGQGEHGRDGASGAAGKGRAEDSKLDGGNGVNAMDYPGPCANMRHAGGEAGTNSACPSANATAGGSTSCPTYNWSTYLGGRAEYSSQEFGRGLGGEDESFDSMSGAGCNHATESGFPTNIRSHSGSDGLSGTAGSHGSPGRGARNPYGSFRNGFWVASDNAGSGSNAGHGEAGGGGGGGGGVAYFHRPGYDDCDNFQMGPSGGGGGAGGCGGRGGNGGSAGGASIGLLLTFSSDASALPVVVGNEFRRGLGGNGGNGGIGGAGGAGGYGGYGGTNYSWISVRAGRGGTGGQGGRGGGGGGGAGGPSVDIMALNADVASLLESNAFLYDEHSQRGGSAGSGGIGGANGSGQNGVQGFSAQTLSLYKCQGGSCKSGFTCNRDDICIPNN